MSNAQHILRESDLREVPHPRATRKVHARVTIPAILRRRSLLIEIVDYYYLKVRVNRARAMDAEYLVDLRFVDASFQVARHIASRWLVAALSLVALAACIALRAGDSTAPAAWLAACGIVSVLALGSAVVALYRTTETLTVFSSHGRAKVLEFACHLGALRAVKPFMTKLAAHVRLAEAARRPNRAEHLRDEMREHFRLREAGVLSAEEYENGKGRILAEHFPVR